MGLSPRNYVYNRPVCETDEGYCYLKWFTAANASGVANFHVRSVARLLGPYPKVKHVMSHLVKHIGYDYYVKDVEISGDNLLHVGDERVVLFSSVLQALMFSDARVGATAFMSYEDTVCATETQRLAREQTIHSLFATLRKVKTSDSPADNLAYDLAAKALRQLQDTHPEDVSNVLTGARRGEGRRDLRVDLVLTSEEFSELQKCFPNMNIYVSNQESHPHALAAAMRYCAFAEFYGTIPDRDTGLYGEQSLVVEFGANVLTHAKRPIRGVHLDSPVLDLRDSQRETQSDVKARALISQGKLDPAVWRAFTGGGRRRGNTSKRCYKRGEECTRTATYGLMLHSHYDITVKGLQAILAKRGLKKLVIYTHFQPSMLFDTHGIDPLLKMTWTRTDSTIRFTFAGDSCLGYSHDYNTYVYLLRRNHVRADDGTIYVVEKTRTYRATVRIELIRCEMAPTCDTSSLCSSVWYTADCEEVHLTSWRPLSIVFGDSMVGPTNIRFERVRVTCSRRLFDQVLKHCLRSGDKTFTFNEVYSAASSFATRLTINGVNIQADKYVSPLDLLQVVLVAYSIAYRERHDIGRTLQTFTQSEKALRARERVSARDFLSYLFSFGPFKDLCGAVGGYWNGLLQRMGQEVANVSQLEFAIFAAVREVTIDELITHDNNTALPTIDDDYDSILNDLRVVSVDTAADESKNQAVAKMVALYTDGATDTKGKVVETKMPAPSRVLFPSVKGDASVKGKTEDSTVVASEMRQKKKDVASAYRSMTGARSGDDLSKQSAHTCNRLKHGVYSCMYGEVVPMPGDGACAYHTMLHNLGLSAFAGGSLDVTECVDAFRNVLYALAGDDAAKHSNLRCPTTDRNGWGTDEDYALLCKVLGARYCVHLKENGKRPVVTLGYNELHGLTGDDVIHVQWSTVDGAGVHVDAIDDRVPRVRRLHRLQLLLERAAGLVRDDQEKRDRFDQRGRLPEVLRRAPADFRKTFRTRAGVKLAEMVTVDEELRTALSADGATVVDLGSAPGAFVAVVNAMNPTAAVTALTVRGDITMFPDVVSYNVEADLLDVENCIKLLPKCSVVLADAATDNSYASPALFTSEVGVATAILEVGGTLLIKSSNLLRDDYEVCTGKFTSIRALKPPSSRPSNTEVYYVMTGFSEGRCGEDQLTTLKQDLDQCRWAYVRALAHLLTQESSEQDNRMPTSELNTEIARLYKSIVPSNTVAGGATNAVTAVAKLSVRAARMMSREVRHVVAANVPEPRVLTSDWSVASIAQSLPRGAESGSDDGVVSGTLTRVAGALSAGNNRSPPRRVPSTVALPVLPFPGDVDASAVGEGEPVPEDPAPVDAPMRGKSLKHSSRGTSTCGGAARGAGKSYSCVRTIEFRPSVTGPADVTGSVKTGIPRIVEHEGRGAWGKVLDCAKDFVWSTSDSNIVSLRPLTESKVTRRDASTCCVGGDVTKDVCTVGRPRKENVNLIKYTRKQRDFSCQVGDGAVVEVVGRATLILQKPVTRGRSVFPDSVSQQTSSSEEDVSPLELIRVAGVASPGLVHRGVALIARGTSELLFVGFVVPRNDKRTDVSPGVAKLMNGDDAVTTIDTAKYKAGAKVVVETHECPILARLLSVKRDGVTRCVVLLDVTDGRFEVVPQLLASMVEHVVRFGLPSVSVSVDSMRVAGRKAVLADYVDMTDAARVLRLNVYSDRGEDLSFVKQPADETLRRPVELSPVGAPSGDSFARRPSEATLRDAFCRLRFQAPVEFGGVKPNAYLTNKDGMWTVTVSWCSREYCSHDVVQHRTVSGLDVRTAAFVQHTHDVYEFTADELTVSGSIASDTVKSSSLPAVREGKSAVQRAQEAEDLERRRAEQEQRLSEIASSRQTRRETDVALTNIVTNAASSVLPALSARASLPEKTAVPLIPSLVRAATTRSTKSVSQELKDVRTFPKMTKSEMGLVAPPVLSSDSGRKAQLKNALTEYVALARASLKVYAKTARDLLVAYKRGDVAVLAGKLAGEEATIYDCSTGKVLAGRPMTRHMTAYNLIDGFVPEVERTGEGRNVAHRVSYAVPPEDPVVIVTRNTKVFLDEKILRRLDDLRPEDQNDFELEWVNGVPGCGKTSWIVNHFRPELDLIVTTTVEAATDVTSRVVQRLQVVNKKRVRTVSSVLVNGTKLGPGEVVDRVLFDEALMNHFGAVVAVAWVTGAKRLVLIGDVNQIPYIDRQNLFKLNYVRPDCVAQISKQLLCTHRNPIDVAYALRAYYPGIYSSCRESRSLSVARYSGVTIPATDVNTLYLTHTQGDKAALLSQGFGSGDGSTVLTIHEAQGLTYDRVVVVRSTTKPLPIFSSLPHAVVAVSRHRKTCTYYSDVVDDAVGKLVTDAMSASEALLYEYNMRSAIASGDKATVERMKNKTVVSEAPRPHHQAAVAVTSEHVDFEPVPPLVFTSSAARANNERHSVLPRSLLVPEAGPVLVTEEAPARRECTVPESFDDSVETVDDPEVEAKASALDDATLNELVTGFTRLHLARTGGVVPLQDLLDAAAVAFASVSVSREQLEEYIRASAHVSITSDPVVGSTVQLKLSGGYLAETEVFGVRRRLEEDLVATALLRGLPALAHRLNDYYVAWRSSEAAPLARRTPSADKDIPYLQSVYDLAFPGHADILYENDQMCVDASDLSLGVDRLTIEPCKSYLRPKSYATMQPVLKTMMPNRRLNSQKEAVLGIIKRNLNAPKLADACNTRHFIGECMATNFLRSAVDPDKVWLLDAYRDDPIDLSPALVTKWLETQKPQVAQQAESEKGLDARGYNTFSYMVKADLKPPLEVAAQHEYASVQTIAYNTKDVNVVFCTIFPEVRDRLLRVLQPKLQILTGMSPDAFVEHLNTIVDAGLLARCHAVENDMRKYDKSQDAAVLQFECTIMRSMGVAEHLIEIWYNSHAESRFVDKHNGVAADVRFQRRSGDASTFLGNTLFCMAVVLATYDVDDVVLGLFAGDDSLLYMRSRFAASVDNSGKLAALFNLESKLLTGYRHAYFCSKFLLLGEHRLQLVPDPMKTLCKLGRRDLRDAEHVEEYRRSIADNLSSLGNAEWHQVLSDAVVERYKLKDLDLEKFFCVLHSVLNSPEDFSSLYRVPEHGRLLSDPSREVFKPKSQALARGVLNTYVAGTSD